MKTIKLMLCACGLLAATTAMAQTEQEIQYVQDPSQGYLFNRFQDNWFITAEGGVNMYFQKFGAERKTTDRFSPAAGLYLGKWFSPVIGVRVGANWLSLKGISERVGSGALLDDTRMPSGKYKTHINLVGPVFDVMVNLTNWWCGYKPGRIYNASLYVGAGGYWTYAKKYNDRGESEGYKGLHDKLLTFRAGLLQSFNVSKQVQLSLDLRWSGIDGTSNENGPAWNRVTHDIQAYLGVTYLFKKREWSAPIVPICPEPENCDALRARLAAADARIADLEAQLRDCLNRPMPAAAKEAPLATIYYPINVSRLTKEDVNVLTAISNIMKDNSNKKYDLTGWADNYTGTEQINVRLRHARVNGVAKQLKKMGVPDSQLNVGINNGNLNDMGEKYVALDRAVTIEEAK